MAKDEIIIHKNQQTMFTDELKENIDPIIKGITFNNSHIVASRLFKEKSRVAEALYFELEAQFRFGITEEKEFNKNGS